MGGARIPMEDRTEFLRIDGDTIPPNDKIHVDGNITIHVAFGDGAAKGYEVTPTLATILARVERVINIFDAHCFQK